MCRSKSVVLVVLFALLGGCIHHEEPGPVETVPAAPTESVEPSKPIVIPAPTPPPPPPIPAPPPKPEPVVEPPPVAEPAPLFPAGTLKKAVNPAWEKGAVLATMQAVGSWQVAHPSKHPPTDWTQAAGYTGLMALARLSKDPLYEQALLYRCREVNKWKPGPDAYHADDHCVSQTYLEFYAQYKDPAMIEPTRARFDEILAKPAATGLKHGGPGRTKRWTWCDALFMSPPAWLKLGLATGEQKYIDFMDKEWKATAEYLYDKEEHLFFRDDRYFDRREENGAKVFWSRGNGWVLAGLARLLTDLPKDSSLRPYYETKFKEMAAKILSIQQSDGLWSTSLLDPAKITQKETSGTGFFCYALAWGINNGLLDRATYEPAVTKAWVALVACVEPDGKLTGVQPLAADPFKFPPESTEIYGVGAFLLAGSQVYLLAK